MVKRVKGSNLYYKTPVLNTEYSHPVLSRPPARRLETLLVVPAGKGGTCMQ